MCLFYQCQEIILLGFRRKNVQFDQQTPKFISMVRRGPLMIQSEVSQVSFMGIIEISNL